MLRNYETNINIDITKYNTTNQYVRFIERNRELCLLNWRMRASGPTRYYFIHDYSLNLFDHMTILGTFGCGQPEKIMQKLFDIWNSNVCSATLSEHSVKDASFKKFHIRISQKTSPGKFVMRGIPNVITTMWYASMEEKNRLCFSNALAPT